MSDRFVAPPELPDEGMEAWETAMRETARFMKYPPTPDIAGSVRHRMTRPNPRMGYWRLAAALVALAIFSLAVPEVRAFVLDVIRIGAVHIFHIEPTITPATSPTAHPIDPVLESTGETTLADAEARFGQSIPLPTYPTDLGTPDHVYAEDVGSLMVTLVWTQPDDPSQVRLVLQLLDEQGLAVKYSPWGAENEEATTVKDRPALWLTAVHQIFTLTIRDRPHGWLTGMC